MNNSSDDFDHTEPSTATASEAEPKQRHWTLSLLLWSAVMGLGAFYGITGYTIFAKVFSNAEAHRSGLMTLSFLAVLPLCIGTLTVFMIQRLRKLTFWEAAWASSMPLLLFVFIAGALLREGFICILMALPLVLGLGLIGAILGMLLGRLHPSDSTKLMSVTLLLPFATVAVEQQVDVPDSQHTISRSVLIQATPETVWHHINFPTDISPQELANGWAYRIGVPYPIEGRTLQPGIGGRRHLVWQRGVSFDEQITDWQENRRVAWTYSFGPDAFPPGSLDDHIVIGGRYFNLENTAYTLTPESGGTRLNVDVSVRVSTNFNWYAGRWAEFLVADTAETILGFYKHRSETR